jgi:hypothetical protein
MSGRANCRWAALAVYAALAGGCEQEPDRFADSLSGAPVQGLEDALLYVTSQDDDRSDALLLDLARRKPSVTRHRLPHGTISSRPRAGHPSEALLLSAGRAAGLVDGRARDAVNSFLMVYDRGGERARYELSGRYEQLAQSEDGRFVIAYAASGSWSTADSIAVVDFESTREDRPVPSSAVRALNGQGPSAIAFAPPDSSRRLAVLVMTDAINLIDLEQPDLNDKVLPLKLPNGSASLRATKVVFHEDRCFVQSDNGSDVLVVRLEDDADSASGFRASLLSLATEGVVRDMALIEPDSGARLLALSDNGVRVIDTTTGDGETTRTVAAFKAVLPFQGRSPFDDETRPRALLYAPNSNQIGFVDLQAELSGRERSVEIVTLSDGVQQALLAQGGKLALLSHSSAHVSLVDLEQRTVSRVGTEAAPRQLLLDQRGSAARAWIATVGGGLGVLDLASRSASPLVLDRPADALVFVPGRTPHVAVTHAADSGRVTLVDAEDPSREGAREIVSFAFSGLFD